MSARFEERISSLENELGELMDREAIREVIHRYCQAVDRCDLALLKSCYHADGFDDHGFFAGNAHDCSGRGLRTNGVADDEHVPVRDGVDQFHPGSPPVEHLRLGR